MLIILLSVALQISGPGGARPCPAAASQAAAAERSSSEAACDAAAAHGAAPQDDTAARCADMFETPDERVKPRLKLAPGAPPLLNFRYFEGKVRQRFSGIDLMLDDAGH